MSTARALVIAVALVVLDAGSLLAQDLRAQCPAALPSDLAPALALELEHDGHAAPDVVVHVLTPCERAGQDLEIVVETSAGARLGPLRLEVAELAPRIRGRVAALWIAEHVRVAREAPAPSVEPAPTPPARPVEPTSALGAPAAAGEETAPVEAAPERERMLVRGDFALSFGHDVVVGGVGPGADLRLELGTRGRPGIALELGIGGAGITASTEDSWTELRASLGGLLDVMLDHDWGAAFGVRLLFVHEVFTGNRMDASSISPYRIDDALDIRAAAFATGRRYVHEGLSVFAEAELGVLLFSFVPSWAVGREQNLVQGVLRVGVGID